MPKATETTEQTNNKKRWVEVDLSFFPFLKNGFHEFTMVKVHDSKSWENKETETETTRFLYRCLPTDADNLADCEENNLYPVFRSYDEIKVGTTVLAKRENGRFIVYPITFD